MGVSGSGKSTVAALLAAALGCQFQEGDDLHPRENVEKMRGGAPLTDADRQPWLRKIAEEIDGWRARGECGVLTCSALKRSYRDIIIDDRPDVVLVHLKGSRDLIQQRMAARHEHFMPIALLDSQFATLEEPTPDERPIIVDVDGKPAEIAHEIVRQLEDRQHQTDGSVPPAPTSPVPCRPRNDRESGLRGTGNLVGADPGERENKIGIPSSGFRPFAPKSTISWPAARSSVIGSSFKPNSP